MSKDRWFSLYEEKLWELEDEGHPNPEDAAAAWANQTQADEWADYADMLRQRKKEEGF